MTIELPDIEPGILGYTGQQCGQSFAFLLGAISHQEGINANGGVCPDADDEENEEEVEV